MADSIAIKLNGNDYAVVPHRHRRSGRLVAVEPYSIPTYAIQRRDSGIGRRKDRVGLDSILFHGLISGFGRDHVCAEDADKVEPYQRFYDSQGVDTRWDRGLVLGLLDEDSTETGLEVIRASEHYKNDLWALWQDNTTKNIVARKYVGSTTSWDTGGDIRTGPSYYAVSSSSIGSGTSLTFAHSVSAQSDRVIVVGISTGGAHPTGITYNGVALTRLAGTSSLSVYGSIWYLTAPATGSNNVVVSLANASHIIAGATNFYHVDQATPLSNAATLARLDVDSGSIDITTTAGDFVVDALTLNTTNNVTFGAGQTERWDQASFSAKGAGSTEVATGTTTTMSWTLPVSTAATVAYSAARVNGVPKVGLDLLAHKTHLLALIATGSSQEVYRSTDGATWTAAFTQIPRLLLANNVTANEDINAGLLAEIGGEAVAIVWDEDSGTITFFSGSDAGNVWADEAVDIPSGDGPLGVAVYPGIDEEDKLYVLTVEGLHEVDVSPSTWTIRRMDLDNSTAGDTANVRRLVVHQDKLWIALSTDTSGAARVVTMDTKGGARTFEEIGMDIDDSVPTELLGGIHYMVSAGGFLFASVGGEASSRNSRVICHNGKGWHSIARDSTGAREIQWIDVSARDDGVARLHYAIRSSSSASDTQFQGYPLSNPQSGVSFKYQSSGFVDLPYVNGGLPTDSGAWLELRGETRDLGTTSTEHIDFSFGADGAARSTTAVADDFISGTVSLPIAATKAGSAATNIGFRVNLKRTSGDNTLTPKLDSLELRYLKQPDVLEGFRFTIDLDQSGVIQNGDSPEGVYTKLKAARTCPRYQRSSLARAATYT